MGKHGFVGGYDVDESCSVNLDKMAVRSGMLWTESHLSKCLAELGYVRKDCTKRSMEATREAEYAFREVIEVYRTRKDMLVFGDEVPTVRNYRASNVSNFNLWLIWG
jgi:hypothetical protein